MLKLQAEFGRKHGQSTNSKGCGRQPGTKDLLNYKGILAGRANGPDRHWVGWGAAIGTEALDGARARPTATLRPRAQLYFGVNTAVWRGLGWSASFSEPTSDRPKPAAAARRRGPVATRIPVAAGRLRAAELQRSTVVGAAGVLAGVHVSTRL